MQYTLKDLGYDDYPKLHNCYLQNHSLHNELIKEFVDLYLDILNTEDSTQCYVVEGNLGSCQYVSITFTNKEGAKDFQDCLDEKLSKKAKRHGDRNCEILTFSSIAEAERFRLERLGKDILPPFYDSSRVRNLDRLRKLQTK